CARNSGLGRAAWNEPRAILTSTAICRRGSNKMDVPRRTPFPKGDPCLYSLAKLQLAFLGEHSCRCRASAHAHKSCPAPSGTLGTKWSFPQAFVTGSCRHGTFRVAWIGAVQKFIAPYHR